jgi:hypothetical protein
LNKISIDVKRKDGTLHTPVTPEAMATIFFYAGLMMIFSHFADILTLSLDGASENGRVGLGGADGPADDQACNLVRSGVKG